MCNCICNALCANHKAFQSALSLGYLYIDVFATDALFLFFCVIVNNWFQFLWHTPLHTKDKNMAAESKREDLGITDND